MFYSEDKKQYSVLNRRTFLLYLLKVSFFGIVGWRLYDIQIKNSQKYKTLSKSNQIDIKEIKWTPILFSNNISNKMPYMRATK